MTPATDAQTCVRANPFDVILSDLQMPGMDGPAFHASLLAKAPHQAKRIAVVSGAALAVAASAFLAGLCWKNPLSARVCWPWPQRRVANKSQRPIHSFVGPSSSCRPRLGHYGINAVARAPSRGDAPTEKPPGKFCRATDTAHLAGLFRPAT